MKTAKKLHTLLLALALFATCGAGAQSLLEGTVRIAEPTVSRTDGKLFVSMEILLENLQLATNRELFITPAIMAGSDSVALPAVTVAGRNRYFQHLRNDLNPADAMLYRLSQTERVEYRTVLPYEPWMTRAEFGMTVRVCGCCGELEREESLSLVHLNFDPRSYLPAYLYVRPEAAPKINVLHGSAYIDFPVNRTEIYENYRRNPEELQKIRATIDAVRNDSDSRIMAITVKGFASPEGPYNNNVRLASGRTRTLKEYVRNLYAFPDSLLVTEFEPEDWEGLERFVEQSGLTDRDGMLEVIRSDMEPDARDRRLKTLFPEQYAFLLREVYPALRHSDYTVRYQVRAYTDIDEIRRLLRSAPQKLSLEEMYLAAQGMEPGSDEYVETFEIAVRMFPDDPVANLNAANTAMGRGELEYARRYLKRAGDSPEADYARGVLAAIGKEYRTALTFFGAALEKGCEAAREQIEQIEEIVANE
ncbi:MAG: DUF3868 domain-containing protein [Rikenellaceae bacterium]|nr:DUF3868 domain-containing protein [Rikenellaceae bacterium]